MEKCCIPFAIVVLLLMQQMITCLSMNHNITTDQTALLALQSQISSFDPRNVLASNWSTSTSVCSWIGVFCGRRHLRVTALVLSGMNLRGTIPPQVGNLSFLVRLNIRNNRFHGSLPEELAHLRRLKLINFVYNNFTGPIPSFLGLLTKLEYLYLSSNQFSGNIPPSLFNITNLKDLGLRGNGLGGEIPREISSLCCLTLIDLQDNKLIGSIPPTLFNQSSLEVIGLTSNTLHGKVPANICDQLPNLEQLGLSMNRLDGFIPRNLHNCSKLQFLGLAGNDISGTIPVDIGNLTMLTELYLGETHLKGKIPVELGHLQRLQAFELFNNTLSGSIPASIFNISTLRRLSIVGCQLSGSLPPNVGQRKPNLEVMYLGGNKLSGVIPASISNASRLTALDLSYNNFSGSIPDSIGHLQFLQSLRLGGNNLINQNPTSELTILTSLTRCRNLRVLTIELKPLLNGILPASIGNFSGALEIFDAFGCILTGIIPQGIGNLSNVIELRIRNNSFTGFIPTSIGSLRMLQSLDMGNNMINGTIPNEICYLENLAVPILSGNQISGPVPPCLGNVTTLRKLFLDSNRLSSNLPKSLWSLKDLFQLKASSNSFTGVLPPEIGNLKAVTYIDFSDNNLSGMIPSTIGGIQNLVQLNLSHNVLDGPIPDSFNKLVSLESLDLSYNNLSGEIPKTLEALVYLNELNISFNKLSGEIPTGGPFANFTSQSFVSNGALCGDSRLQVPPCQVKSPRRTSRRRARILYSLLGIITSLFLALALGFLVLRRRKRNKLSGSAKVPSMRKHERVSYHELQRATNGFSEDNLLGIGSFSTVYKGIVRDGMTWAIKVFKLELEGAFKSFDTECDILRSIRHRNLTKVITSCSNPDFKAIVLEYMPNGTLDKWLYSNNLFLDLLQRLDILLDVAAALDYLHNGYSTPVVHCDLKPSNVLLDQDMVGHVSDFGIAKLLGAEDSFIQTKTIATIGYIAPEYGQDGIVSTSCDVYSFGIMVMEAFTGKRPSDEMFTGDLSLRHWVNDCFPTGVAQLVDVNLIRPEEESLNAKMECLISILEVALRCTSVSPDARININEALLALKKIRIQLSRDAR